MQTKKIIFIFMALLLSFNVFARDSERYPIQSAYYAGGGIYLGDFKAVYQDYFIIHIQVYADEKFNKSERTIIKKAFEYLVKAATDDSIIDCALKRATTYLPKSKEEVQVKLFNSLSVVPVNEIFMPSFVFVASYKNDSSSVGIAYNNLFFWKDSPFPGQKYRHYLHFALNTDHLGDESSYFLNNNKFYWASVIIHEMLHNLGYTHSENSDGKSFIEKYDECFWNWGEGSNIERQGRGKWLEHVNQR